MHSIPHLFYLFFVAIVDVVNRENSNSSKSAEMLCPSHFPLQTLGIIKPHLMMSAILGNEIKPRRGRFFIPSDPCIVKKKLSDRVPVFENGINSLVI